MRTQLPQARLRLDSHPGLLLQRYVSHAADGTERWSGAKRDILQAAISAASNAEVRELFKAAFTRWKKSLPQLTASNELQTRGRVIVGLGSENVLETGIRLHHTYGLPILPGSALKGLAAHYCDQSWGPTEEKFEKGGSYHQLLFGTTKDSGCITFHDAWLTPDSLEPLKLDVMTPHHPKWLDGSVPPTDFDSPVPVPYVSVDGRFCVALSWQGPPHLDAKDWTMLALTLLKEALSEWGAGGKTSSGYGRLIETTAKSSTKPSAANMKHTKRLPRTPAKVTIKAARPKGGFDVEEQGFPLGTLTVGEPGANVNVEIGAVVDVLVHNDDPKKPQYKWPPKDVVEEKPGKGKKRKP